ncbi:barstar family protein [Streptomyces sp. SID1143]|uniref:barstar family protein n=1 Tax=Streptomyces sp. SID1143 TaxID=3425889 RepID=UPI0040576720
MAQAPGYVLHSEDLEADLYALPAPEGFFEAEEEYATFRAPGAVRLPGSAPDAGPDGGPGSGPGSGSRSGREHESLQLRVLDADGGPVAAYTIGEARIEEEDRPDGLVDLRVTGWLWDLPRPGTDRIWALWRQAGGTLPPGAWAPLDTEDRRAWLDAARLHAVWRHPLPAPAAPAGGYVLDGSAVTDRPGLYCALGEAMGGPGGYYGASLDALKDCLHGGFGPTAPFTLTWQDLATARTRVPEDLEKALGALRAAGVTVRPA